MVEFRTDEPAEDNDVEGDGAAKSENEKADGGLLAPCHPNVGAFHPAQIVEERGGPPGAELDKSYPPPSTGFGSRDHFYRLLGWPSTCPLALGFASFAIGQWDGLSGGCVRIAG